MAALCFAVATLFACRGVLGIEERTLAEVDDSGPESGALRADGGDGSSSDGSSDASSCPNDCGYCGHVCQGACVTGVCEGRLVVATGSAITSLTARGIYLPFSHDTGGGRVRRVAKAGGSATELQSGFGTGFQVVLGVGDFVWASPDLGQVGTFPINGGARKVLVPSTGAVGPVAVVPDGHLTFFATTGLPCEIRRLPTSGGPVGTIKAGLDAVTALRASGDRLYYSVQSTLNGGLYAMNHDGTDPKKIYTGTVTAFEIDGTYAFVSDAEAGVLGRVLLAGGGWTILANGRKTSIALDTDYVYVSELARNVVSRIPKQGGLIRGVASAPDIASHVTVDDNQIYWVSGTSIYASPR